MLVEMLVDAHLLSTDCGFSCLTSPGYGDHIQTPSDLYFSKETERLPGSGNQRASIGRPFTSENGKTVTPISHIPISVTHKHQPLLMVQSVTYCRRISNLSPKEILRP